MQSMSGFYMLVNAILFVYVCYSWYWQAKLELRGKFRISILIWTLLIIWLGFTWNYIEKGEAGINVFLALLLLVSIVDGYTGFAPKRAVVSGYFKRTLRYSEIERVLLIRVPLGKRPSIICILGTTKGRQYNLQFKSSVEEIVHALQKYADHQIRVEVRNTL